jgi:hypothetical protein
MGSKSKSNKLICRYCGGDDLAPSFIKRRDRRCRKCFSKRYGSAVVWLRREMRARARKSPVPFRLGAFCDVPCWRRPYRAWQQQWRIGSAGRCAIEA